MTIMDKRATKRMAMGEASATTGATLFNSSNSMMGFQNKGYIEADGRSYDRMNVRALICESLLAKPLR